MSSRPADDTIRAARFIDILDIVELYFYERLRCGRYWGRDVEDVVPKNRYL
jgi:hypothetical protein